MAAGVRDGDCLCNRPAGVTFVEILGQRVGLSGAEALFARWAAAGLAPESMADAEILAGLQDKNYVSDSVAVHYAAAVRTAYARWRARARKEPPGAQG